jgi:hypothetical protein
MFLELKKWTFRHFSSDTVVIDAAKKFLNGKVSDFFEWLTKARTTA